MKKNHEITTYVIIGVIYVLTAIYAIIHHIVNGTYGFIFMGPVSLLFLLVPFLTEKTFRQHIGFSFKVFALVFAYFAFSLGVALRLYDSSDVYDKIMHLISGVLFFCVGFYIYTRFSNKKPYRLTEDWILQMTYAFFFSMAIAVIWEIYEFMGFVLISHDAQHHLTTGVFDTMLDLISCFVGSLVYAVFYGLFVKKKRRTFFISLLESITPQDKVIR